MVIFTGKRGLQKLSIMYVQSYIKAFCLNTGSWGGLLLHVQSNLPLIEGILYFGKIKKLKN